MTDLLPWFDDTWKRLTAQFDAEHLAHALLISGPAQIGKSQFVDFFSRYVLCAGKVKPCNVCDRCHLLDAETHPDYRQLTPEDSKQIRIEQIRDMIEWASQTSQQGGWKICVIQPAEAMNVQSANALLKCLEEPAPKTLFFLITDQPMRLLPTIRSRCQVVNCPMPSRAESYRWLSSVLEDNADAEGLIDIAGGLPLKALYEIDEDYKKLREEIAESLLLISEGRASSLQVASSLAKADIKTTLQIIHSLLADNIVFSLSDQSLIRNKDLGGRIMALNATLDTKASYELLDKVLRAIQMSSSTSNANPQMILEWLLGSVNSDDRSVAARL